MSTHAFVFANVIATAVVWEIVTKYYRMPPIGILNRIALMTIWLSTYSMLDFV